MVEEVTNAMQEFDTAQNLASDMEAFSTELEPYDQGAAERLRLLSQAIVENRIGELSRLDLRATLDPAAVESRVLTTKQKRPIVLATLELLRNVLVLAPLVVTWFSLGTATQRYYEVISKHQELSTLPFLFLWQQGFPQLGGRSATFQTMATIDGVLLIIVLLIASVVHYSRDVVGTQAEIATSKLSTRAEQIAWRLNSILATHRYQQEILAPLKIVEATEQFKANADALLDIFKSEQTRLESMARDQESSTQNLTAFGSMFEAGVGSLTKYQDSMQSVYQHLSHGVDRLSLQMDRTDSQQRGLLESLTSIGDQAKAVIESAQTDRDGLRTAVSKLGDQISQNTIGIQILATAADQMKELGVILSQSKDSLLKAVDGLSTNTERVLNEHGAKLGEGYEQLQKASQQLTDGLATLSGQETTLLSALTGVQLRAKELFDHSTAAEKDLSTAVLSMAHQAEGLSGLAKESHASTARVAEAIERTNSTIGMLLGQQSDLRKSLADTQSANQQLQDSYRQDLQSLYGRLSEAVNQMTGQITKLETQQRDLIRELGATGKNATELTKTAQLLGDSLRDATKQLLHSSSEGSAYVEDVETATEKLGDLADGLRQGITQLGSTLQQVNTGNTSIRNDMQTISRELRDFSARTVADVTLTERQIDGIEKKIGGVETQIEAVRQSMEQSLAEIREIIKSKHDDLQRHVMQVEHPVQEQESAPAEATLVAGPLPTAAEKRRDGKSGFRSIFGGGRQS